MFTCTGNKYWFDGDPPHGVQNSDEITPIPDGFRVWEKRYNPEISHAWRITEAIIIELQEKAASIGSELLVVYIPARASIYEEEWQATKRKYGISDENWDVEQAGVELQAIC